jgi:(R,R)-butanediol dehydrogenase / meso-butanediol dehydrogenase / diacetyl reductase
MQAAVYYGKEDIRVESVPVPLISASEVLLRVRYAGICGTDMSIYAGKHPRAKAPLIAGHEIFGRIETIGGDVQGDWKTGMRVAIYPLISCHQCAPCREGNAHVCERLGLVGIDRDGGFAEFVKVEPGKLYAIPDNVSDEEAAVLEPLAVAVHAVENSRFRTGDTVLVTGGGPIGILVAQVLRASGAREVVISEVKAFRCELAARMGFKVFNPAEEAAPAALERLIGARFTDCVFEATGHPTAYSDALQCCKVRGGIAFVGIPKTPPQVDVLQIVFKELFATSARVYRPRDYRAAITLLARRSVDVRPLIETVPLRDAPLGFQKMKAADSSMKILIAPPAGA